MADSLSVTTQGPTIINPYAVPIGLPQIRICPDWMFGPNPPKVVDVGGTTIRDMNDAEKLSAGVQLMVAQKLPILDSSWSIGGVSSVAFKTDKEEYTVESGWPTKTDLIIPISTSSYIECSARELSPFMAQVLAGESATKTPGVAMATDTGFQLGLGNPKVSEWHRVELWYDFPKAGKKFVIILPKAQVSSSEELTFSDSEGMEIPFTITAGVASSGTDGIATSIWNDKPHGNRMFIDVGTWVGGAVDASYHTEYQTGSYVEVATVNVDPANERDEADAEFAKLTTGNLNNMKLIKRTPTSSDYSVSLTSYASKTAGDIIYVSAAS